MCVVDVKIDANVNLSLTLTFGNFHTFLRCCVSQMSEW